MFPPLPPMSGLHPLVIHFPIGLLLAAPMLMFLSIVVRQHRLMWACAAFAMMVMGTLAIYVAAWTGEMAEDGADFPDGIDTILNRHEQLAEISKYSFTGLAIAFGIWLIWNRRRTVPIKHLTFVVATIVYLMLYGGAALVLANTAHNGGRLVHEFGVKAPTAESAATQPTTNRSEKASEDGDK